jgi:hypothetical protein
MRWTLWVRETGACKADGEVVWFWRPDAGAKLATILSYRGLRRGQESPVPEEITKETVKPLRGECRNCSAYLW